MHSYCPNVEESLVISSITINLFLFKELEGVMNSLLSLILVVTEKRDDLIKKFCNKVAEANSDEDTSLSRLRM